MTCPQVSADTWGHVIESDRAEELLDDLMGIGLVKGHKTTDSAYYKSSYLGVARMTRTHIAQDQEIDRLRVAGEGDTLDYKRIYNLNQDSAKHEFVKDVTALTNAGGLDSRYLLLGVEDDGEFYVPDSVDAETAHREALDSITETRLQQIVASRTTHSPSVRVSARGKHRAGPYILIELTREVGDLPYRVYKDQIDRTSPNAHKLGEVWIRKGSIKALATAVEIAALEHQASLYRQIRGDA